MQLTLETPADGVLRTGVTVLQATCLSEHGPLGALAFSVRGVPVPCGRWAHEELARARGVADAAGLSLIVDLGAHLEAARSGQLPVDVDLDGVRQGTLALRVTEEACAAAVRDRDAWAAKRAWLLEHVLCPVCRARRPEKGAGSGTTGDLWCAACGTRFPQDTAALNLLTPDFASAAQVVPTGNVSANGFDALVENIVAHVRAKGGMVLDDGAGVRTSKDPHVVNLEIVDYPTTDVIAVGQHLPFPDDTFDAVLSLAVLEHVAQPFECAAEIARVLKPGGLAYVVVPFLQNEHGYPHHYYNMTRRGLVNLFDGQLEVQRQFVPKSGAPLWGLHAFLHRYSAHLEGAAKQAFLNMTVEDIMRLDPATGEHPLAEALAPAGQWILACTTAAVLTKPGNQEP